MKNKREKLILNATGWIGMILVQSATLPVTYQILQGTATHKPPISMVLLIWSGLFFYLIRGIMQRDIVHIVSNSVGITAQSVLMALIVFGESV